MSFYIGLSLLSNNGHAKRTPHGLLSAESRRVLSCLEGRPLDGNDIKKDENGRPYLPGNSGDFSISHSGTMAAVSLVKGEALRTGCDIQIVRPRASFSEIAGAFFSVPEKDYILSSSGRQFDENRFFEIWALKECYLKLRGLSVLDMASSPSFISGNDGGRGHFTFGGAVSSPLSFYLYELSGNSGERYYLAAAIEGQAQSQPVISWFSQSFFPCRSIEEIRAALSPVRTASPNM